MALLEATSPGHREFFYVVAGDVSLSINAFEATDDLGHAPRVLSAVSRADKFGVDVRDLLPLLRGADARDLKGAQP